ncbi:MAG: hypothetical protein U1F77_11415 [Kiritimatiellia bacterium]
MKIFTVPVAPGAGAASKVIFNGVSGHTAVAAFAGNSAVAVSARLWTPSIR